MSTRKKLLGLFLVALFLFTFLFACKKEGESTIDFSKDISFDVTQAQFEDITLEEFRSAVNTDSIAIDQSVQVTYKEWIAIKDVILTQANGYYVSKDGQVKSATKTTHYYTYSITENGKTRTGVEISSISYEYFDGIYLAEKDKDGNKTKRKLIGGDYDFSAGNSFTSLKYALYYVNSNDYYSYQAKKAVDGKTVIYNLYIRWKTLVGHDLYFVFENNTFIKAHFVYEHNMGDRYHSYLIPYDGDIILPDLSDYEIKQP